MSEQIEKFEGRVVGRRKLKVPAVLLDLVRDGQRLKPRAGDRIDLRLSVWVGDDLFKSEEKEVLDETGRPKRSIGIRPLLRIQDSSIVSGSPEIVGHTDREVFDTQLSLVPESSTEQEV